MKFSVFRTYPSSYLLKDRSTIATGPFGLSITSTCMCLIGIMTVLYAGIWKLENDVFLQLFGLELPWFFKISSCITTAALYCIFFNSVAMAYMLLVSCFNYLLLHTAMFGFLCQIFANNKRTMATVLSLLYYEQSYLLFYFYMLLTCSRILMTLPLCYYVVILAAIRIQGGTGREKLDALEIEKQRLAGHIEELKVRLNHLHDAPAPGAQ